MSVTWTNTMDGKDYPEAIDNAIEGALVKAGAMVERQAAALTPVDSGRLKGSVTYATKKERSDVRSPASPSDAVSKPGDKWTLYVGTNVEYAPYLEYGTVRTRKQSYLRPALHEYKHRIVRDFGKWVQERLKRGR